MNKIEKAENNSRSIKVLIVLGGLGKEGITNSVLTYLETMNKRGLDLSLAVAGTYEETQMKRAKAIGIQIILLSSRNMNQFKYFLELKKIVEVNKFQIVHVHGNSATLGVDMLAAKLGGAKVRIAHSRNTSCTHPNADRIMRPLFNHTYTDGFACGIDAGKWLFGNRPFTVIPNGKKIEKFLFNAAERKNVRKELMVNDETIILGHVGVFNKQKNHVFLIDVFSDLLKESKRYVLCLFGEDNGELRIIKDKVLKLGIQDNVRFMGYKTDVNRYMSAMDIMVFPSLYEGLPNVVIEWQMAGLPCFISDTITKECCIMDNVYQLPINKGTEEWVNALSAVNLEDRENSREFIKKKMSDAGFDIEMNAELLREKYLELGAQ